MIGLRLSYDRPAIVVIVMRSFYCDRLAIFLLRSSCDRRDRLAGRRLWLIVMLRRCMDMRLKVYGVGSVYFVLFLRRR